MSKAVSKIKKPEYNFEGLDELEISKNEASKRASRFNLKVK
jgi:hypothetical protein